MRNTIRNIISSVEPLDEIESRHISDALKWVDNGEEIFRIEKPDTPPKHLVSYFVLIDKNNKKVLLLDHIKAELWLPSGGHIEPDEHPKATVKRESIEELNLSAKFLMDNPVFISQATTVGKTAGHTDVSLWYLLSGDSEKSINYDRKEFNGYKWFECKDILKNDIKIFDSNMHRFIRKIESIFDKQS